MVLIYSGVAWLLGICAGLGYFEVPSWLYFLAGLPVLFFLFTRRFRYCVLALVCIGLFAAGMGRAAWTESPVTDRNIAYYNGNEGVEITGVIKSDPEILEKGIRFTLEIEEVSFEGAVRVVSGKALVYSALPVPENTSSDFPHLSYGDRLKIRGAMKTPPQFETFDYREYLARQGISSTINYPEDITFISAGAGSPPLVWIHRLRD
ncbi:MAG: ComEC/Rec2 family competence protein, partial [Dehalococcoidia bacterium]|nr:ComEC/Rec2 family competence protein [Dehalococcoidia bacterium]